MPRILVLLICLLLALQAPAAALAQGEPCPMQDMMESHASAESDASRPAAPAGDCCNDHATYQATGQSCKTGQDCHVPAAGILTADLLRVERVPGHAVRHAARLSQTDGASADLWRPPTLI